MKLLCYLSFIYLFSSLLDAQSIAFYYGNNFIENQVNRYDYIVVQPENIDLKLLNKTPDKYFAYLSITETNDDLDNKFVLGKNKDWNSNIVDIRKSEVRNLILEKAKKLKEKGFKNFFFDTLDSYLLVLKDEKDIKEYQRSLIDFFRDFKKSFPNSKIIVNRGFEIIDYVKDYVDYLAAESLFYTFDVKNKKYIKQNKEDTNWLLDKLNKVKQIGIKVIVIDYVTDDSDRVKLARDIKKLGFIPYISDYNLESWGDNEYEKIKRDIIIFYDSNKVKDKVFSQAHRIVSMPLEYYGYRPKLLDINNTLPFDTKDVYGIIFCLENDRLKKPQIVFNWIKKQIENGKKVLFLGYFPFPYQEPYLSFFQLKVEENKAMPGENNKIYKLEDYANFEIKPRYFYTKEIITDVRNSTGVVIFQNSKGQRIWLGAITSWGGFVIDDSWIVQFFSNELLTLNPFIFFKKSLRLKYFPVPDITTENGSRLLFVHIDGDGFISKYENDDRYYSSEILKKEILDKYKIPHSISVIRYDFENPTLSEKERKKLLNIASNILDMDNVEIANHSYSHPLKWMEINSEDFNNIVQVYSFIVPGYKFDMYYEIIGTKNWLEKVVSKKNKKNNLFFWTGDCIAPYEALKILNDNDMLNINGGYTAINKLQPYLSLIAPYGIERDGYYQIYTGEQNENIYTNLWHGPFGGYKKVIETFDLTDKPYRLKPIDIYYHFYSASKYSSLKALKDVYNYALKQRIIPIFTSDYIKKALDFYKSEIYEYDNNYIFTSENIKTLRVNNNIYPEISLSVIGYKNINSNNYIHLYGNTPLKLILNDKKDNKPYLIYSNSFVDDFNLNKNEFYIKFKGYVDIKYKMENISDCITNQKDSRDGLFYIKEVYGRCK